ncbi:MAG: hypothetical protein WC815_15345 [Vicinamibacterales bacterium]|jgi:hypothetical protein
MTFNERVHAVSEFGFTTRQARFLVTVMLHGGVCLPRQYARLAGTAYGHKVNVFFNKLVSLRYAVRCRCVHNRAAVYHVRHQPLYRAIGVPHSRNRKPVAASRVIERLMLLDAVISHPDLDWLATATDKVAYFSSDASSDMSRWPQQMVAGRRRYFPDHLPIGVSPAGQIVFVFLAASSLTDDLKAFLQRHAELLRALPISTVRLVLPPSVAPLTSSLEAVVRDELAKSQSPVTGRIESEVLPVSYRHLSPLTKLARPITKGVEEGERRGEHTPARPQPPQVEYDADDPAGCARDWRRLMDAR